MSKKIKTEKVYQVPEKPGTGYHKDTSEGTLNSSNEYDENGNLLLEVTYYPDGNISEKNEYAYDGNGNIIQSIIYSEEGDALETRNIQRDERGIAIREEIVYMDGSVDTVSYSYENGVLAGKVQETDEGEVESREVFEYEGDKVILYEKYDEDDELVYRFSNHFENGILRKSEVWSSENGETFRQEMEYDERGRRRMELKFDDRDKLIERNQFETDDEGKVIKVIEENTARKNTTEFSYDARGNVVLQHEKDMNGQTVTVLERYYDEEGRLSGASIEYKDRTTGLMRQNHLVYEYEYFN